MSPAAALHPLAGVAVVAPALVMAPFARLSSDRSLSDWHRRPALRRWGSRLRRTPL